MLNRLQQKWKVNGWRFILILATFAIGGSLCGYTGRRLMPLLGIDNPVGWLLVYLLLITLLWPLSVMLVSIPLGQFSFFTQYLSSLGKKMGLTTKHNNTIPVENTLVKIAIFASGTGTNAKKIIEQTTNRPASPGTPRIEVSLIVTNKAGAGVLEIAKANNIPGLVIEKDIFYRGNAYVEELQAAGIDFIVLAGFLWKVPATLIKAFPNRIVNIHPALLPAYGGKGMYGHFVHEAVLANGETESGITIHWVDEQYDHGSTIFQARCPVLPGDTADSLAARIHKLEHEHYPAVITRVIGELAAGKINGN
ncbi:MAG: phosphoribosylglycinamide formyltransferase [Bacteroidota bacterium]